ncbi:ACP S-malonyltransferase [Flexivirga oryzae]|uniref:[acyl-carrier-protein] S-malonyltransferase n=1 Tax=Flexivirga oryzae TaxID=1794944 RepID=A0A839NFI1_9MICO|nr:ACP S-malonyltransferase [Flexivirga oryzae]MBB2893252.1 malonyl CoA-acyl carrier protein transacylase [Flexivirga oryzae]
MRMTLLLSGQGETPSADVITMWRCDDRARAVWEEAADTLKEPLDSWLDQGDPTDTYRAQVISAIGSMATYAVVAREVPIAPSFAVGHSVGEVAALGICRGLSVSTVAQLVAARGRAMHDALRSAEVPTGMRAVVDPPAELAELVAAAPQVYVANHNSTRQIVISGTLSALDDFAATSGLRLLPLKVKGAFHTPFMQAAADRFRELAAPLDLGESFGPAVIRNRTATPYPDDADLIDELARQIVAPVRWAEALRYAYMHGSQVALDLSSTGMLTRMAGCPGVRHLPSGTPDAIDAVQRELRHVLAVEGSYDLAARALGAIVSTPNHQPDRELYRDRVIPAYQELRAMVGRADQQPDQILGIVDDVLRVKQVDEQLRDRKMSELRWRAARFAA